MHFSDSPLPPNYSMGVTESIKSAVTSVFCIINYFNKIISWGVRSDHLFRTVVVLPKQNMLKTSVLEVPLDEIKNHEVFAQK
jgi:hypothetical protein